MPLSRTKRWHAAAQEAINALEALVAIQQEYQDWLDALPENLNGGAVSEKLETICELDLSTAWETAQEAADAELPRGFGRD